ncbi:MAG TPA: biotin--[acetyl-CoA-carboxylase] ligase [Methyloceanibacter sp.]|jgi:BirA family transcriptional regulator, biotin operon repressor / biotin---[acetyl-CoA-carboxylase] ligase|nr:biotin--[acetyl-CoA-carboxylase] ligase [Methyloceanibacter sp.]
MSYFTSSSPKLPPGYRLLRVETVDSTNAEAKRRAKAGEPGPLWIWSARQSQGRGRGGREWISQHGNLFATLLIGINCPIRVASQLALVAGVVTYDTIAKLIAYEGRSELLLKWPNDVLLAGEKLAGMLLENVGNPAENRSVVVIGTGINLANHPEDLPQPAISLGAYGMTITPADALEVLASTTHEWLSRWAEGTGFPSIRRAWLDRAGPTGRPLRVKIDSEETDGVYAGLDADGALRLLTPDGSEHRITAGDVFFLGR